MKGMTTLLPVVLVTLTGCPVYLPHASAPGASGVVVDSQTGEALNNASARISLVECRVGSTEEIAGFPEKTPNGCFTRVTGSTRTSLEGAFEIDPEWAWHWYFFPLPIDPPRIFTKREASLSIEAADYQPFAQTLEWNFRGRDLGKIGLTKLAPKM